MVINLQNLIKNDTKTISQERVNDLKHHYDKTLAKYGYLKNADNQATREKLVEFCALWWAWRNGECAKPTKSICLYGEKGVGKTMFFRIFSGLFDVNIVSVWDLVKEFSINSHEGFWRYCDSFKYKHLIIDDLGNEENQKSYGNELPIGDLLRFREDYFRDNLFTFLTTNILSSDGFIQKYGDTVWSRMAGMCEFIPLNGVDRRIITKF